MLLHRTLHIILELCPATMLHLQGCVIVHGGHQAFQKGS